jgi:hypothetical protein
MRLWEIFESGRCYKWQKYIADFGVVFRVDEECKSLEFIPLTANEKTRIKDEEWHKFWDNQTPTDVFGLKQMLGADYTELDSMIGNDGELNHEFINTFFDELHKLTKPSYYETISKSGNWDFWVANFSYNLSDLKDLVMLNLSETNNFIKENFANKKGTLNITKKEFEDLENIVQLVEAFSSQILGSETCEDLENAKIALSKIGVNFKEETSTFYPEWLVQKAKANGIQYATLTSRLRRGWTQEEASTKKPLNKSEISALGREAKKKKYSVYEEEN